MYKQNRKLIEIDNHPLLDLFNVKINQDFTSVDMFDLWSTYLALQGKFYMVYDNPVMPQQLQFLYPHFTRPVPSAEPGKLIDSFQYDRYGDVKTYSENLILWDRNIDPLDYYQGLSAIRAMARTIDTENSTIDWNKSTIDNSCIPAGAIGLQNPSKDVIEKVKKDWKKKYSGAPNARTPLIVDTERISYVPFGLSPIDMDFLNQRKLSRIEICSGFGVPGQVVGDPEGQTYSNYEEALKSFWNNTVLPRYLRKIKASLNKNIVRKWDQNLYIDFDLSNVEVLQENQDSKTNRVVMQFESNIIKLNEARTQLGYEEDTELGDKYCFELPQIAVQNMAGESDGDIEDDNDVGEDGNDEE
jgi:HK97 family phage portal protein